MQLVRYSPRKDVARLERDLDKMFGSAWDWPWATVFQDLSTVDMYTEDGKLVVKATLPGFKKEEIKLNASGDTIDITAEHEETEEKEAKREYLLRESSRSYQRRIMLPDGAMTDKAEAEFGDGTLIVTMHMGKHIESKELAIK